MVKYMLCILLELKEQNWNEMFWLTWKNFLFHILLSSEMWSFSPNQHENKNQNKNLSSSKKKVSGFHSTPFFYLHFLSPSSQQLLLDVSTRKLTFSRTTSNSEMTLCLEEISQMRSILKNILWLKAADRQHQKTENKKDR